MTAISSLAITLSVDKSGAARWRFRPGRFGVVEPPSSSVLDHGRRKFGLAGVSRDQARLFLDRVVNGPIHPVRVWLNLDSVSEVDALHREWQKADVLIRSAPEPKPWGLYEFIAEDGDGNSYRVFHDTETPKKL